MDTVLLPAETADSEAVENIMWEAVVNRAYEYSVDWLARNSDVVKRLKRWRKLSTNAIVARNSRASHTPM